MRLPACLLSLAIGGALGGNPLLERMETLRDASSDGIIRFSSRSEYQELVVGSPDAEGSKGYHVIMLYTIAQTSSCPGCGPMLDVFQRIAASFDKQRVFFGLAEAGPITAMHQIVRVPHVTHVGDDFASTFEVTSAGGKKRKGKNGGAEDSYQFQHRRQYHGAVPEADRLLAWTNAATRHNMKLQQSFIEQLNALFALLFLLTLGACVLRAALWLLQNVPEVMAAGAMLISLLGMSGLMWNIINAQMKLFGQDPRTGVTEWFVPSSRGQHLGEGLLFGSAFVAVGSGLVFIARWRPQIGPKTQRRARNDELLYRAQQTFGVLLAAVVVMNFVNSTYRIKSGWAMETPFFPPSHFKTGRIQNDQGISF
ncbi:unnamed protein product [Amoebophrya sp. A25]|nr:unnamed protein product [Amoebophrya sp. A25]|eukprot:GSA25T00004254001.1